MTIRDFETMVNNVIGEIDCSRYAKSFREMGFNLHFTTNLREAPGKGFFADLKVGLDGTDLNITAVHGYIERDIEITWLLNKYESVIKQLHKRAVGMCYGCGGKRTDAVYVDTDAVYTADLVTQIMMNLEKAKNDWPFSIGRAMAYFDKINISEGQLKDGRYAITVRVEKNKRYEAITIPIAGRNAESFTLFVGWYIKRTADDFYNSEDERNEIETMYPRNIVFNGPATIVEWYDGTKTVVKCQKGDTFDPLTGVAMCALKKMLGTNESGSNYLNDISKLIDVAWEAKNKRYKKKEEALKPKKEANDVSDPDWDKGLDKAKAIDTLINAVGNMYDNLNQEDKHD